MTSNELPEYNPKLLANLGHVLDAVNFGVWIVELASGGITANTPLRQILGLNCDSEINLFSDIWKKIIHPDDFAIIERTFRQISRGEHYSLSTEIRIKQGQDTYHWFVSHFQVLDIDRDGAPLTLAGTLQDIDRNKHLAHMLYESERSKSVLLSNLPGMAYRCSFDPNWTMSFVSDGCFELTGYTPFELIANRTISYNDVILPEFRSKLYAAWEK